MKPRIVRRAAALGGLAALVALTLSAAVPTPPVKGVSYRLRMNTRLPVVMQQMDNRAAPTFVVKVKSIGKNARFEFDSMPQGTPMSAGDYLLYPESGRALRVSPREKVYDEAPTGFGTGGPLSMLNSVAARGSNERQLDITGIDMDLQQLDDETLNGRQVRHYQLVAEFYVEVMNNNVPIRIEMETWTADLPASQTIINPFDIAAMGAPVAGAADPASKLTQRLLAERKKMQGTPLKTSMNFIVTGLANGAVPPLEFGQTTEIFDLREVDIDPKELDVPAGFTRREPRPAGRGGAVRRDTSALRW